MEGRGRFGMFRTTGLGLAGWGLGKLDNSCFSLLTGGLDGAAASDVRLWISAKRALMLSGVVGVASSELDSGLGRRVRGLGLQPANVGRSRPRARLHADSAVLAVARGLSRPQVSQCAKRSPQVGIHLSQSCSARPGKVTGGVEIRW